MPEIDRRGFLKIVGTSAGAAVAAGCSDIPQKLVPYVIQPEVITPGIPVIYASTCRECPAGCGLHVRTREGRPIKLEGNPDHPVNRGKLCARGQAGTQRTYHPGRFKGPMRRSGSALASVTWDEALGEFSRQVSAAGSRTWVLGGETGPTLGALLDGWVSAVGAGGRVVYEPLDPTSLREAARIVFGVETRPRFDLSHADFIIDFGSDFMESWVSPVEHARQYAEARNVGSENHGAKLVYVGPRQSMTAGNADEWLAPMPGSEGVLALAIARAASEHGGTSVPGASSVSIDDAASRTGIAASTIRRLGKELAASHHPVALPPGAALTGTRGTATAAAVLLLNAAVGAVGDGLKLPTEAHGGAETSGFAAVSKLMDAMKAGEVAVLVIHDSNPVYSVPGFADALKKVGLVVTTGPLEDETSAVAHLVLPDHTPLESWGDVASAPGVRSLIQPTLRPLYDTRALGDTLLDSARVMGEGVSASLPAGSFRTVLESAWSDTDWREALARGGVFGTAPDHGALPVAAGAASLDFQDAKLAGNGPYTLLVYPSPLLSDGRGADIPWLQETPDPVTKVAWDSWVEVSRETARTLGVGFGDVISIETGAGSADVAVLVRGGIRDDVIAVPLGQGHTVGYFATRASDGGESPARGINASSLLPPVVDESGGRAFLATRAKARKTGATANLPLAQRSDNQRGRQLAEAVPLATLTAKAGESHGGNGHGEDHGGGHGGTHEMRKPFDPADDSTTDSEYRWGMSIDLDRCNGCSACIVACSIENNVPTVGEEGVQRNRQMQWLRIERYIDSGEATMVAGRPGPENSERLGDSDVRHLPMLCQQCGSAPCEPVCPVFATYHNPEGLNGMIYNRCIGTRYCSNNCRTRSGATTGSTTRSRTGPSPCVMGLNPDVTVRGQGVMEKCTFCIQRIEGRASTGQGRGPAHRRR